VRLYPARYRERFCTAGPLDEPAEQAAA